MNTDDFTAALGGDYDTLKQFVELRDKYESTHYAAEEANTHFTDPKTGIQVPKKFYQSGKKQGQSARWPKLYKQAQKNKALHLELRVTFSNAIWFIQESHYSSVENFLEAYESGEWQEKWGDK
jgi:hypothetical protein